MEPGSGMSKTAASVLRSLVPTTIKLVYNGSDQSCGESLYQPCKEHNSAKEINQLYTKRQAKLL